MIAPIVKGVVGGDSPMVLAGCRVLDLAEDKGAYCSKLLAGMGAEVIKIERPEGDPGRSIPPFKDDVPHPDGSIPFLYFNTNKKSATLNLSSADGRALFRQLARTADVIVEGFPPGFMHDQGLDYDSLKEISPGLIMVSITPFGQSGPYRDHKADDLVGLAMGGTLFRCGDPNLPPCAAPGTIAHDTACMYAATAVIMALIHRLSSGTGQYVDVSVQETAAAVDDQSIARYSYQRAIGRRDGGVLSNNVPSGIYPCKDGHVRICTMTVGEWISFFEWMGNPEALAGPVWYDPQFRGDNRDIVELYVREFAQQYTMAELHEEGQRRHIPITPANTAAGFMDNEHIKARGYFVELEHPYAGKGVYAGVPCHFSETSNNGLQRAPLLGEHNQEIYGKELGLTSEEMTALRTAGVI